MARWTQALPRFAHALLSTVAMLRTEAILDPAARQRCRWANGQKSAVVCRPIRAGNARNGSTLYGIEWAEAVG